ncbi:hypothetical protein AB6A40_000970 [Gnathostoma spinigerum]|uniref:Forkhead box protein O n=1 Tax=Gnathostoma spinigerum TaxID=75299 RepID=A0ABD6EA20_9BILA
MLSSVEMTSSSGPSRSPSEQPSLFVSSGIPTTSSRMATDSCAQIKTESCLQVKHQNADVRQSPNISGDPTNVALPSFGLSAEGSPTRELAPADLEDLSPVSRDRCNTWPLRRPQLESNSQTSPIVNEPIPEESNDFLDSSGNINNGHTTEVLMCSSEKADSFSSSLSSPVTCGIGSNQFPPSNAGSDTSDAGGSGTIGSSKKSTTRRNAWGNMSYADLITQAIISSPEKRLTLSQVYEWMVQNVPYFRDKGDSNSSAGWKNSIRHNLSLHSRFMRIQNEGAGKSSWWVINPDAKPGRNPRRQRSATLETSTKAAIEKKRRGARKKVLEMRTAGAPIHSVSSSVVGSQASIVGHEQFGENDESAGSFEPIFRSRTQSNLSVPGSSSRVSPSAGGDQFEDFDFPPFVEASTMPHDILDRTNEMNLDPNEGPSYQRGLVPSLLTNSGSTNHPASLLQQMKQEPMPSGIKIEMNGVQPPPSYHELNAVRGVSQLQNPLLRTHLINNRSPTNLAYTNGLYSASSALPNWMGTGGSASLLSGFHPTISCSAQQTMGPTALPMDLENLTLPEQPLMEFDNMEAVLRHELSQSASNQLSFDNI